MQRAQSLYQPVLAKSSEGYQNTEQLIHSISVCNRRNCLISSEKQYKYTSEKEKKIKSQSIIQPNIIVDNQILAEVLQTDSTLTATTRSQG